MASTEQHCKVKVTGDAPSGMLAAVFQSVVSDVRSNTRMCSGFRVDVRVVLTTMKYDFDFEVQNPDDLANHRGGVRRYCFMSRTCDNLMQLPGEFEPVSVLRRIAP